MIETENKNMLLIYLNEVFDKTPGKRLALIGCKRIAVFYFCAIRAMRRDVAFFIDPEMDGSNYPDVGSFMDRPVYPMHRLIYEDMSDVALINTMHDRADTDVLLTDFGLREDVDFFNLHGFQSVRQADVFDPLTGYGRRGVIGNFHIHGSEGEGKLRIVTIGGATTDYSYSGIRSWPDFLHEMLEDEGIPNVIFNGGINGFTSCEERDIVLRDVPCLKPDIVLSLSGECDIGYIMTSRQHPWYSRYSAGKLGSILGAHLQDDMKSWFDETGKAPKDNIPDSRHWIDNQRIIHASLSAFGIKYLGFLQPIIFEGGYKMSSFEKSCMEMFLTEGARQIPSIGMIFSEGSKFYRDVREYMKGRDYLLDLSGAFDGACGVYSDGVHYDEEGNRLIARAIADTLRDNDLKDLKET